MSGLINFIKGLFAGILGLFGGKKGTASGATPAKKRSSNGFFLELDEAKTSVSSAVENVASKAVAVATEATPAPKAEPAKQSTRKEKLAALAQADAKPVASAKVEPSPVPAPKAAPVQTVVAETAFATKYLVPTNDGARRRPGANMSPYLTMARQMR